MWSGLWGGWGFRGLGWLWFECLEGTCFGRAGEEMNGCGSGMNHILSKDWVALMVEAILEAPLHPPK